MGCPYRLKRGVARCGFDIDITAYADIDIKSHSPGRVLRTPLDPSGQAAPTRCPNPTLMRRYLAAQTHARDSNPESDGVHPHDGRGLCAEVGTSQGARADRLRSLRATGAGGQGRHVEPPVLSRDGPGAVHRASAHWQQREPDRACHEQQPAHGRHVRLAQREQSDERPAVGRASIPENFSHEDKDSRR